MYTVVYSSTKLTKKDWDFIMKVLRLGPHPGWGSVPKWSDPIFLDDFVYAEGDINWPTDQTLTLMRLCQVSCRVYTKDRNKLWTCCSIGNDEDIADNIFGPHDELGMVHP